MIKYLLLMILLIPTISWSKGGGGFSGGRVSVSRPSTSLPKVGSPATRAVSVPARPSTISAARTYSVNNPVPRAVRMTSTFTYRPMVYQPIYYQSHFNSWFLFWLIAHNNSQAEFIYHREDELSKEDIGALRKENKDLDRQLKALKDKGIPRDPAYSPKGVDPDLIYSDDYMKSENETSTSEIVSWILVFCLLALLMAALALFIRDV